MVDELQIVVEDINSVDEKYRGAYREDGGKYFLNGVGTGGYEIADTTKLKNALNLERKAKESALKVAKGFEKYSDVDLDAAVDALSRIEEFDAGNIDMEAEVKRKLDAQAQQLVTQHNEKLAIAEAKSEKLMGKLRTLMIDNVAINAINEEKGNVKNLLPHVRGRVKVVEVDDDFDIQVLTETGEPAVDGEAKPVTMKALINGFKKDFPFSFKGAGSTGGGGVGKETIGGTSEGGKIVLSKEDARDPEKYRMAREKAQKEGLKLVMEEG